ncbi:MAG: CBS domain-containing protein [Thermoproteus sp.]
MKAGAIAKRPAITVEPSATIEEAARIMTERRIGFLPVVSSGRLVGVISERDIVRAIASGASPKAPVEEVMRREVVTVNFNDDVEAVWSLMREMGIRHIVVMRGDEIYGVISIRDFLAEKIALERLAEAPS